MFIVHAASCFSETHYNVLSLANIPCKHLTNGSESSIVAKDNLLLLLND